MGEPSMFLWSTRIEPGLYPLAPGSDAEVRTSGKPLRPGVVSAAYYPAGFSPFEGPAVESGPVAVNACCVIVESLCPGWQWNAALLSLARAEHPGVVWRTRCFEQLGGAPIAFGVVGREVVAIVAPFGDVEVSRG